MTASADYQALHDRAILGAIAERSQIAVAGPDRAAFLQGLLSNDILALTPGRGCYATWLTPHGRMLCDLQVLESGDMILLDVPKAEAEPTAARLEQFHFTEDVHIANLDSLRTIWLHGPAAPRILNGLHPPATGTSLSQGPVAASSDSAHINAIDYAQWSAYQNGRARLAGTSVVVARIDQLGVPGFALYVDAAEENMLIQALVAAGAVPASAATLETARIEAGYPVFGVDMTSDTIPLEAGIEDRAISLTKGCYVGQEVIIRVLHRGHGRVVRKLVRLEIPDSPVEGGDKIFSGDRDVGSVTSAAASPVRGFMAFAYLHRDFVEPGTLVEIVRGEGRVSATVVSPS